MYKRQIERVVGKFLYYARAIDNTMLHALNDIASSKSKGTQTTWEAVKYFLNYASSNPDAEIIFRASEMLYKIDSDAAYLVCPEARSRAGGYHYLGNADDNLFNGLIHVLAKIIKNVMSSAAEAEVAGLFMNAQHAVPIRLTLEDMGHPQPPTQLRTDNLTAQGILSGVYKRKRSKWNDMNFHWIRCRVKQKQFKVMRGPGKENLGDSPTKHHPAAHHKKMRPINLYVEGKSPSSLKGCVKLMTEEPVTQSKPNIVTATAALTHRIRFKSRLNYYNARLNSLMAH